MIEKVAPITILMTAWVSWAFCITIFDSRRYRYNTMPYLYPSDKIYAHQIELDKLGKVYKFKEHLTKSMYEQDTEA